MGKQFRFEDNKGLRARQRQNGVNLNAKLAPAHIAHRHSRCEQRSRSQQLLRQLEPTWTFLRKTTPQAAPQVQGQDDSMKEKAAQQVRARWNGERAAVQVVLWRSNRNRSAKCRNSLMMHLFKSNIIINNCWL